MELSIGTLYETKISNSVIIYKTVSNKSYESVFRFKYLGTSTHKNSISDGILRRMNCGMLVTC